MDPSKAHLITLWCAVLSKSDKGVSRVLPEGVPVVHFRVLGLMSLPDAGAQGDMQLARSLVMKPVDVQAALEALGAKGLVRAQAGGFALTREGRAMAQRLTDAVARHLEECRQELAPADRSLLAAMLARALDVPGSFHAGAPIAPEDVLAQPTYRMTAFAMMRLAIASTVKSTLGLSFTDFRFLLELYPKKRDAHKMLRARDMVGFLRTGRSYVSTASVRLAEAGLIERIPDPDDARGILFALTPAGAAAVQEVGEDIFAVFVALSDNHADDSRFAHALKQLLKGQEKAYARLEASDAAI